MRTRVIKRPAALKQAALKRPPAAKCNAKARAAPRVSSRVHGVQIGLGTFGTIPENLAGTWPQWDKCFAWLLSSTSEARPEHFRGIVVEPVPEHVARVKKLATKLPHLRFVQGAVSEKAAKGVELHMVTQVLHDKFLKTVCKKNRHIVEKQLLYLRNMSSVGGWHPFIGPVRKRMWENYGVDIFECVQTVRTDVWSYANLAEKNGFCGCELLIIDTEGHDAKIIRSMIRHCKEQERYGRSAWPDVIQFETCGICDETEGKGTEAATIELLKDLGYFVVLKQWINMNMIRRKALESSPRLQRWLEGVSCATCEAADPFPLTLINDDVMYCKRCVPANPV